MAKYKLKRTKNILQTNIDSFNVEGYLIKPKNKIDYGLIKVTKLVLINNSFIEMILKKKIKRKLDTYLKYIIAALENESSDDDVRASLSDIERYKAIVINRYAQFLDEKYLKILLKKIELFEKELKKKALINKKNEIKKAEKYIEVEEKTRKSR